MSLFFDNHSQSEERWHRRAAADPELAARLAALICAGGVSVPTEISILQHAMPTEFAVCVSQDAVAVIDPAHDDRPRCVRRFQEGEFGNIVGVACARKVLIVAMSGGIERLDPQTLLQIPSSPTTRSPPTVGGARINNNVWMSVGAQIHCVACDTRGSEAVAAGCRDGSILAWDSVNDVNSPPVNFIAHRDWVTCVSFLPKTTDLGKLLLCSCSDDGSAAISDFHRGVVLSSVQSPALVNAGLSLFNGNIVVVMAATAAAGNGGVAPLQPAPVPPPAAAAVPPPASGATAAAAAAPPRFVAHRNSVRAAAVHGLSVAVAWDSLHGKVFRIAPRDGSSLETELEFETPAVCSSMALTEDFIVMACEDEAVTVIRRRPLRKIKKRSSGGGAASAAGAADPAAKEEDEEVVEYGKAGEVVARCGAHQQQRLCGGFSSTISSVIVHWAPPKSSALVTWSSSSNGELLLWVLPPDRLEMNLIEAAQSTAAFDKKYPQLQSESQQPQNFFQRSSSMMFGRARSGSFASSTSQSTSSDTVMVMSSATPTPPTATKIASSVASSFPVAAAAGLANSARNFLAGALASFPSLPAVPVPGFVSSMHKKTPSSTSDDAQQQQQQQPARQQSPVTVASSRTIVVQPPERREHVRKVFVAGLGDIVAICPMLL